MANQNLESDVLLLPISDMSGLMVDLWRIFKRAKRDPTTPETVVVACEAAIERTTGLGFCMKEMIGERYDGNQLVQVVHCDGGQANLTIGECLSPAVYFQNQLIKRAEVVLKGEEHGDEPNS
ncbi:MAG: hypothetical protein HYX78_08115 [Armatimonadetes bacterium]|nr:hypothetical protein [Armatimonadota bacterium]